MKEFASSAILRIFARFLAAGLQAGTLILLARQVIPADFGMFGQAQSLGMILTALLGFGFSSAALVLGEGDSVRSMVCTMYIVRIVAAVVAFAVLSLGFTITSGSVLVSVIAASGIVAADMVSELTQGVLSGARRHLEAAILVVLHRAIPLAVVIASLFSGEDPFTSLLLSSFVTAAVACIPALRTLRRPVSFRSLIGRSRDFWFASMSGSVLQLDTSIARVADGLSSAGYYAAAARLGAPMAIVTSSIVSIMVPELTRMQDFEDRRRVFRRLRRFAWVTALLIAALTYPTAALVVFLLGEAYAAAFPIMCAVLLSAGLSGISQMYQAYLFSLNEPKVAAKAVLFGSLIGLVILAVSGSIWGLQGLAVGPIAVQAAILVLFVRYERRIKPL